MVYLNSPENQKLFKKSEKGQKLNTVMLLICSVSSLFTSIINITDTMSFEKNKIVVIIFASVAIALWAALIIYDIYYLCRYTVKIKGVLARWVADIAQSSDIFKDKKQLNLTCCYAGFSVILQRDDGRQTNFDLTPVKSYPNITYVACELIFKYVHARVYADAQAGKPHERVVLQDATGKKIKTRILVENGVILKRRVEKNYFIKHGLIN